MFGIDSSELLLIAIVALVVIGPKELPGLLRTWGKWMAQMRGMASEFRGHVDEMVRQSELDDVKKQLVDLQSLDPTKEIKSIVQEGVAEGEKALADAKSTFDNPLAEPRRRQRPRLHPRPSPHRRRLWPRWRPKPPAPRHRLPSHLQSKRSRPRPWPPAERQIAL
jgi:sec-independent protein translocase protein TatB